MIAALTLLCLLALSMIVVRIGSTALRLTGMSQAAARFQALSAFSGTGFTTSEAEEVMRHAARRKILSSLMVIGNLGVMTVLSTIILGLLSAKDDSGLATIIYMVLAVLAACFLALSERLDVTMCGFVEKGLLHLGWASADSRTVLAEFPNGDQLVEYKYSGAAILPLDTIRTAFPELKTLRVNGLDVSTATKLASQDRLLCFAHFTVQQEVSDWLGQL
ncbi:hypothetical protein [uncultured Tateyamaria sp.]|uniref:hypothetical protein n=1 Tax=uncultured Tateyamaria sp. TaxID=455651 RepID=UPI00261F3703|nr:hypothetical protein [uncultured Tateyamaria sp.]